LFFHLPLDPDDDFESSLTLKTRLELVPMPAVASKLGGSRAWTKATTKSLSLRRMSNGMSIFQR
jgi:hypothetical protein